MAAAPPQPFIRTEQPAAVQARPPRDLVNRALSDPVRLGVYALLTLVGVLSLFPLYWLFVTSLSPTQFVIKVPPEVLPHTFTLVNYQRL
ncbi:MAG: hypothetical protein JO318_04620, partial [Chloroflexi bacterium]|nr:hypothetical protein [Chloroflexota bacterium]